MSHSQQLNAARRRREEHAVKIELKGFAGEDVEALETLLLSQTDVSDVRRIGSNGSEPEFMGVIAASGESLQLITSLHYPIVAAGAAATAAITAFSTKVGAALGEIVAEWMKARFKQTHSEARATIFAPDGTVVREVS